MTTHTLPSQLPTIMSSKRYTHFTSFIAGILVRSATNQYVEYVLSHSQYTWRQGCITILWTFAMTFVIAVVACAVFSGIEDGAKAIAHNFSRQQTLAGVRRTIREASGSEEAEKEWLLQAIAEIDAKKKWTWMDHARNYFFVLTALEMYEGTALVVTTNFRRVTKSRLAMGVERVYRWAVTSITDAMQDSGFAELQAEFEKLDKACTRGDTSKKTGDATQTAHSVTTSIADTMQDPIILSQMQVEFERVYERLAKIQACERTRKALRTTQFAITKKDQIVDFDSLLSPKPRSTPTSANEQATAEKLSSIEAAVALRSVNLQRNLTSRKGIETKTKTPTWMSLARQRRHEIVAREDEGFFWQPPAKTQVEIKEEFLEVEMRLKRQQKQERVDLNKLARSAAFVTKLINGQACGKSSINQQASNGEGNAAGQKRVESMEMPALSRRQGFSLLVATLKDIRSEKQASSIAKKEAEKEAEKEDEKANGRDSIMIAKSLEERISPGPEPRQFSHDHAMDKSDGNDNDSLRVAVGTLDADVTGWVFLKIKDAGKKRPSLEEAYPKWAKQRDDLKTPSTESARLKEEGKNMAVDPWRLCIGKAVSALGSKNPGRKTVKGENEKEKLSMEEGVEWEREWVDCAESIRI
ncbi:hypothetical protein BKA65DRAFT_561352 [Rhexocercosporidium sp. MPI-PUGE-AT-0058]|nr:hypothetical protein BKA65DRAFT_561352 [Rhexocercosporidium sp. MPI-PUGE-AT-0058]